MADKTSIPSVLQEQLLSKLDGKEAVIGVGESKGGRPVFWLVWGAYDTISYRTVVALVKRGWLERQNENIPFYAEGQSLVISEEGRKAIRRFRCS
jgi:hypothetical protein